MATDNSDFFSPARVAELREETRAHGVILDTFLAHDADCPVFGLNLACAYPFPTEVAAAYENLARKLALLDAGAYVYPLWETHVTIMTLVNFTLHRRAAQADIAKLRGLVPRIIECLARLSFEPFVLRFGSPVLTRKAIIIPISNENGDIAKLRTDAHRLIESDAGLHTELSRHGLAAPKIVHSTIARFTRQPADIGKFICDFRALADASKMGEICVNEIYLTDETRPYMRGGEILRGFAGKRR
jgi:hypothetical protein